MNPPALRLISQAMKAISEGTPLPEPYEFDLEPAQVAPLSPDEKLVYALARSDVPMAYRKVTLATSLHPAVKNWEGEPPFVTFLGPVGSGKTWQATRLLGEQVINGWVGLWTDATVALEQIRQQIATDNDGKLLNLMMSVEVLVLDDLLAERDSEFARDKLSLILRQRYNNQQQTIITSNSTDARGNPSLEAVAKIEPRLASRMAEGIVIKLTGRDRRMPARATNT